MHIIHSPMKVIYKNDVLFLTSSLIYHQFLKRLVDINCDGKLDVLNIVHEPESGRIE